MPVAHTPSRMAVPTLEQPDEILEREEMDIIQLQARWEALMSDRTLANPRHKKVVVLVLYWHKVTPSYLDVDGEIERLVNVLEEKYHYTIMKRSLNDPADDGVERQVTLNFYLAEAARAVNYQNSLLIVYYAGHGNPGDDGDLLWTGGNSNPESKHPGAPQDDHVVWSQAEALIHKVKSSDIFLIFDCCYAGKLCGTFRRSPLSTRNVEFLGATGSDALTRVPGKHSFTSALIWALEELAGDAFTTSELYSKILEHKEFPKHEQNPLLTERGEHSFTRLMLGPLDSKEEKQDIAPSPLAPQITDSREFQFGLSLHFTYDAIPRIEDIEKMAAGFRNMERCGDLKAKHINWGGMRRKDYIDMSPAVAFTTGKLRLMLHNKRAQALQDQGLNVGDLVEQYDAQIEGGLPTPSTVRSEAFARVREGRVSKLVLSDNPRGLRRSLRQTKTS